VFTCNSISLGNHTRHIKMAVFWNVATYSLVDIDRRFRRDSRLLWNVSQYLPDYMVQHHFYISIKRRLISARLHSATSQNTAIFILVAVRTWNITIRNSILDSILKFRQKYILNNYDLVTYWKIKHLQMLQQTKLLTSCANVSSHPCFNFWWSQHYSRLSWAREDDATIALLGR
jgi:hypothetical protein